MKFSILILVLLPLLFCACGESEAEKEQRLLTQLDQLYQKKHFFKLRDQLKRTGKQIPGKNFLFYKAVVNGAFNQPEESNKLIEQIVANDSIALNDTLFSKLYLIKVDNHVKQFQYKSAYLASRYLLENYRELLEKDIQEDIGNEMTIWSALSDTPPQKIKKSGDQKIGMTRDKARLLTIPVQINHISNNFVFDTGANLSVLSQSVAEQLGLKVLDGEFTVKAFARSDIPSRIAVADEIFIGGITFTNVVFLVLADELLAFPPIDYYIYGIIGFPVIKVMGELKISKREELVIPASPSKNGAENLALDGLKLLTFIKYQSDSLICTFDTGADETDLMPAFYKEYGEEIAGNHQVDTLLVGGAGGARKMTGYKVKDIRFLISGNLVALKNIDLFKESANTGHFYFYANLGQDVIGQFDEMILNFETMSLTFTSHAVAGD